MLSPKRLQAEHAMSNEDSTQVYTMKRLGFTMPEGVMRLRVEAFLSVTVPLWRHSPWTRQELLLLSTHQGLIAADRASAV